MSLLDLSTFEEFALGVDLVKQEPDDFSLINVTVVWIDLDQWLDQGECLIGDALAVDLFEYVDEVVPVDHRFINLLIILLQLRQHLVNLLIDALLQSIKRRRVNDGKKLLRKLRVVVNKLRHLHLSLVLLWNGFLLLLGGCSGRKSIVFLVVLLLLLIIISSIGLMWLLLRLIRFV